MRWSGFCCWQFSSSLCILKSFFCLQITLLQHFTSAIYRFSSRNGFIDVCGNAFVRNSPFSIWSLVFCELGIVFQPFYRCVMETFIKIAFRNWHIIYACRKGSIDCNSYSVCVAGRCMVTGDCNWQVIC